MNVHMYVIFIPRLFTRMQNFSGLCALATWVFSSVVSIELEETTIAKVRKIHHAPQSYTSAIFCHP
jgi:hypothetical protein